MTDELLDVDYVFKFVIIGDSCFIFNKFQAVGKSCILSRINSNTFRDQHEVTLGVDIAMKTIKVQGKKLKIRIWDTAGQENFRSITRSYYKGAIGIILVYDITNRISFENIKRWYQEISEYANKEISIILVGNKIDLSNKRVVTQEEGQSLSKEIQGLFLEVSALTDFKIQEILEILSKNILMLINNNKIDLENKNCGIILPEKKKDTEQQSVKQCNC